MAREMRYNRTNIMALNPYITKTCYNVCRHTDYDSGDLYQEMMANLIQNLQVSIPCHQVAITVIRAKNKALDTMRSRKYQNSSKSLIPHEPFTATTPCQITHQSDICIDIDIQHALSVLDTEQRRVLDLVYWQDISISNCAILLKTNNEMVEAMIAEAIKIMRRELKIKDGQK